MAELITVRGNHDGGGVALSERNEAHPSGEAFIVGNMVAQVAKTPEVAQRIASGLLVVTDEPVTVPFDGYDKLSASAVASRTEKMSDNERLLVRQYEAGHRNRKQIVDDVPATSGE